MNEEIEKVIEILGWKEDDNRISELETKYDSYIKKFGISPIEAQKSLIKSFGGDPKKLVENIPPTPFAELRPDMSFVTVVGKVLSIGGREYNIKGKSRIIIYGLLGDGSKAIAYKSWQETFANEISKGDVVEIRNAYTKPDSKYGVEVNIGDRGFFTKLDRNAIQMKIVSGEENPVNKKIKDVAFGDTNLTLTAKVIFSQQKTVGEKEMSLVSGVLADETGYIKFSYWGDESISDSDTLEISNAYIHEYRGLREMRFENITKVDRQIEVPKYTVSELHDAMVFVPIILKLVSVEKKTYTGKDGKEKEMWIGEMGDDTGSVPFVAYSDHGLKSEKIYEISGAYTRSYHGVELVIGDNTKIVSIRKPKGLFDNIVRYREMTISELETNGGGYGVVVTGDIVNVRDGSGYILRCPDCKRPLNKMQCKTHGKIISPLPDLRARVIIDDGTGAMDVLIHRALIEWLLGKELEEIKKECMLMGTTEVVCDWVKEKLVLRVVRMSGDVGLQEDYGLRMVARELEFVLEACE